MPLGMASCPLDFPRPGFLPAGFSAAWRLVRWIFRGMASFPLDFSRLRFSLGSSPRRRPRGCERGLARGARRCRLPRRVAKITTMPACQQRQRISGLSNSVALRTPCSHSVFWGARSSVFWASCARAEHYFFKRDSPQGFCCRSAVSQECEGLHPQSTVDLHAFLGRQFLRM